ncbi:MAG: hypothetical protein WCI05_18105, partial [Myxococcales bacterium]
MLAATAGAQETTGLEQLLAERVVTTASVASERASIAPAQTVTITAEDLGLYGIRMLPEAINYLSLNQTHLENRRSDPPLPRP